MMRPVALASLALMLLAGCGDSPPPQPERTFTIHAAPERLESDNGTTPSAILRAFVVEDDVPRRVEPTRWTLLDPHFGVIDDEGRFIANGTRGGVARVRAELEVEGETLSAETRITIHLRRDVIASAGLSTSIVASFENATAVDDPRNAPFVRYPLEGARLPNDLAPPTIQWDDDWEGRGQDPIRITLRSPYAEVHGYVDGSQIDSSWTIDEHSWARIAEASGGQDIELVVARLSRNGTYAPSAPVRFWMSSRALHLSMLAWELSIDPPRSRLVQLDPATSTESEVVDLGAVECVGCHTVAIDDDRLAATVDRHFTGLYDVGSSEELARIEPPLDGVTFQPGGSLLIGSREVDGLSALFAFDRESGEPASVDGLPTDAAFAEWSPDGRLLAFVQGGSDTAAGTRGPTSIATAHYADGAFAEPSAVHEGSALEGAPEGGETDSHPSFSPDGAFIAFAHGTSSHGALEGSTPATSALYLIPSEGGDPVRLEAAMGPEGDSLAFWPAFAPRQTVEADGTRLYWLSFYSRMPYGNAKAGTRGAIHRQLWVAAIDPSREGDPSFAPFRVPAQRTDRDQLGAAWRTRSCVAEEAVCRVDSECCSGACVEGACAPPLECRPRGASCDEASPCCGELRCEASACVEVVE